MSGSASMPRASSRSPAPGALGELLVSESAKSRKSLRNRHEDRLRAMHRALFCSCFWSLWGPVAGNCKPTSLQTTTAWSDSIPPRAATAAPHTDRWLSSLGTKALPGPGGADRAACRLWDYIGLRTPTPAGVFGRSARWPSWHARPWSIRPRCCCRGRISAHGARRHSIGGSGNQCPAGKGREFATPGRARHKDHFAVEATAELLDRLQQAGPRSFWAPMRTSWFPR